MKRVWNKKRNALLRRNYGTADLNHLAENLGVTVTALKARAHVMKLKRKVNVRHRWTVRQLAYLKKHYADEGLDVLVDKTKHSVSSVHTMARKLGLRKSAEFMSRLGRELSSTVGAKANQFTKGSVPHNKGRRMEEYTSPDAISRSSRTRFKPGLVPHNYRGVGTERVRSDGYVYIKTDSGIRPKHRWVWEQANGPIPDGHNVAFRDGNRQNCDISNLFLISRQDSARRCIFSETEEARLKRVAKCKESRNKTIRRDRIRIHWGLEPLTRLVKRW